VRLNLGVPPRRGVLLVGVLIATVGCTLGALWASAASSSLQASTLTFAATDDSYVRPDRPDTAFGSATSVQVDNSPVKHALFKFAVAGIGSQAVTSAKLRLYAVDGSSAGGDVHRTAGTAWSESSATWNTAPAADPATVASLGQVSANAWYEVDVTSLVSGDGIVSIRITSSSADGADYTSKEGGSGLAPQLVVTAAGSSTPPGNTVPPTITGLPIEGELVAAETGSWSGTPPISYAYQWRRCDVAGAACVDIAGETGASYLLASDDVARTVRVTVTATNGAGSAAASSAAHGPIAPAGSDPPPPPSPSEVAFGAAGDVGGNSNSGKTLDAVKASGAEFLLLLGDVGYSEVTPESAWCSWAFSHLGQGYPLQLISGNHEEDVGPDGRIGEFAKCAPDRMNSTGTYAAEYYFDRGPVRVILIAADLLVGGVKYDYASGDSHYTWLRDRIREAKAAGKWVVVGMHEVCLTAGSKPCSIGDALQDLLIAERVDLVLQGHDHDYQRFHSLRCANPGGYDAACVADNGSDGAYVRSAGTVFAINGTGGRSLTTINTADAEYGYVAAWMGGQTANRGNGFLKLTASATELHGTFVNATSPSGYTDSFVIAGSG
jgi:calcineurin-like phosphoesterase family protein